MARTLKLLIQAFWMGVALLFASVGMACLRSLFSGHLPSTAPSPLPTFSSICLVLLPIVLCVAVVHFGYRAVFRFSPDIVNGTVRLAVLWLQLFVVFCVYLPILNDKSWLRKPGMTHFSPVTDLLWFAAFLVLWPGGTRFGSAIIRALDMLLFHKSSGSPST